MMRLDQADPKGLIRESYQITGISAEECRSIFIDWALSLGSDLDQQQALALLIGQYAPGMPPGGDHPMTALLQAAFQGLAQDARSAAAPPQRRGGRAGRLGY